MYDGKPVVSYVPDDAVLHGNNTEIRTDVIVQSKPATPHRYFGRLVSLRDDVQIITSDRIVTDAKGAFHATLRAKHFGTIWEVEVLRPHRRRHTRMHRLPASSSEQRLAAHPFFAGEPLCRQSLSLSLKVSGGSTHTLFSMNDADLLQAFESCRLTSTDFRHREHLRVAYLYLARYPFEQAWAHFEKGVRRLLAHLGAPASHYHATLTRAWLLAVQHFLRREGAKETSEEFLAAPCAAFRLLNQQIMLTHYSAERLFSAPARVGFLEPDLDPIPLYA